MTTLHFKKAIFIFFMIAIGFCSSCKKSENTENDAANKAAGSFDENHTEMAVDTTGPSSDSITSNSTQTDPTAVDGSK